MQGNTGKIRELTLVWPRTKIKQVETSHGHKVTMLWNQLVQPNRIIPNSQLDIIPHDDEEGTCMLIDVAISGYRIVIKKDTKKIQKYKTIQ
jgi:hypothetical protein